MMMGRYERSLHPDVAQPPTHPPAGGLGRIVHTKETGAES